MANIHVYIFLIVLITAILEVFGLILTLLFPKLRIWPPPSPRSWQYWFVVGGGGFIWLPGVIVVGVLDWGTFWFMHWSRLITGGLLASFGLFFIQWSARTLGPSDRTDRTPGTLVTEGPYQYTRNPTYVGFIFFFIGIILITNSFMALITGILFILWLLLAPFSEEPWLREQFRKEYEEYCKNVPRWIGKTSFKRKSSPTRRR